MSNIAAPKPIEAQLTDALRTLLGAALLTLLLVTFTPFQTQFQGDLDSGNLVNQLGYSALGALALAGHLFFTERRVALSLLRPFWIVTVLWLLFAAVQSLYPPNALRALAFTLFAMLAATGALCLPPHARAFRFALAAASLAVLGLSYAGVVLIPEVAVHSAADLESQHAGLWRGIYSHKNTAGAIMATLFFCGLYLLRAGNRLSGAAIMVLSGLFVLQAGSKTAAALLPLVAALVLSPRLTGSRHLPVLVLSAALAGLALATLGSVLIPAMDALVQWVLPGTTFTGRTDIWRFSFEQLAPRQWTGFGFESFWRTPAMLAMEASRELSWDPRFTPNAHNGYLDIAIAAGWPGLALVVGTLIVLPFRDFVRTPQDAASRRLADLFLMILSFALMNSFLETFLFDRANPFWVMMWFSVAGLRLLARHRPLPN
ncbi:O-antigen ligase family protein [Aureimonas populi]|uniref:O-antigen ligase family protein n=1 Tax=Aureimonas populi TaxID=1701758 RepID=A0ABW5CL45_9HYPH|nr:O-antigen ligase [Aureimonas populi]